MRAVFFIVFMCASAAHAEGTTGHIGANVVTEVATMKDDGTVTPPADTQPDCELFDVAPPVPTPDPVLAPLTPVMGPVYMCSF